MSQVTFKTEYRGKPVEVVAGWDHPLGGFFLTVFNTDPNAEDEYVYSNLDDKHLTDSMGFTRTTLYFRGVLAKMSIESPAGFWELVEQKENNVCHVFCDGKWT